MSDNFNFIPTTDLFAGTEIDFYDPANADIDIAALFGVASHIDGVVRSWTASLPVLVSPLLVSQYQHAS